MTTRTLRDHTSKALSFSVTKFSEEILHRIVPRKTVILIAGPRTQDLEFSNSSYLQLITKTVFLNHMTHITRTFANRHFAWHRMTFWNFRDHAIPVKGDKWKSNAGKLISWHFGPWNVWHKMAELRCNYTVKIMLLVKKRQSDIQYYNCKPKIDRSACHRLSIERFKL